MRRKLLYYTGVFTFGLISALSKFPLLMLLWILIIVLMKKGERIKRKELLIILGLIALGFARYTIADELFYSSNIKLDEPVEVTATINEVTVKADNTYRILCKTRKVGGEDEKFNLYLSYYNEIENFYNLYGKEIKFYASIEKPKENGNPGCFNYRTYLKSRNIPYVCKTNYFQVTDKKENIINKIKSYIICKRENFLKSLTCSEGTKGFIKGVIFGDKNQLEEEDYDDFKNNGTAHVLAVSGLHVGVLYSIYRWIMKRKRSKIITILFILFLLFYGCVTLWSVSVTRAIFLILIMTLGEMLDRRYDLTTALAFVLFTLLMKNPFMILNTGLQMSFLAVASISFFAPKIAQVLPENLAVVLAVQGGMLPYTAYVFNYIPLAGLLCNVPIIFLVSIIVPLGMGAFLLSILGECSVFTTMLSALGSFTLSFNKIIALDGFFAKDIVSPPLWLVALFYLLFFYLSSESFHIEWLRKEKKMILRSVSFILSGIILIGLFTSSPFNKANMVFVDVGQGDCFHLKCKSVDVLIDGGGSVNYNVGKKTLKPYLLKNGAQDVDLAIATHLHTDHYQGLKELGQVYKVKKYILHGRQGERITINENTYIDLLWPIAPNEDAEDENTNSLIFMVNCEGVKTLITGDITAEGEKAIVEFYKGTDTLKCDVLKISHHASKYSSSDEFINAASPKIGVIGVGKNNYGHPSNEVIEKLEEKGIMVFRTDLDGAVGIIKEKDKIRVCTEKKRK